MVRPKGNIIFEISYEYMYNNIQIHFELVSKKRAYSALNKLRWYSKTGTQYRDKLFYIRGVSDEKTV
ncbi:hypothetical protein E8M24_33225 [Bacillus thuringiensis]|nr:hypothetical protein E8M24_33225 [Bacillus thuringiensis]